MAAAEGNCVRVDEKGDEEAAVDECVRLPWLAAALEGFGGEVEEHIHDQGRNGPQDELD